MDMAGRGREGKERPHLGVISIRFTKKTERARSRSWRERTRCSTEVTDSQP